MNIYPRFLVILLVCFSAVRTIAKVPDNNVTAIGQGIASPNVTSMVNLGRGLLAVENPAGLMYVDGFRLSMENGKDPLTSSAGFEASYSGEKYGIAAGTYNSGCDGCLSQNTAILGMRFKPVSVGIRYQAVEKIPTYGLGFVLNPEGKHRLGLHAENENPAVKASAVLRTGAGYSYVSDNDTINLEMSQSKTETTSLSTNSLGYKKSVKQFEVSMAYEVGNTTGSDKFWMGAGFKGQNFSLVVYSHYKEQLLLVVSTFF